MKLPHTTIFILCAVAGEGTTRVGARVTVGKEKPFEVELQRTGGGYDFIDVWALERPNDVLLTVDVGIED